MFVVYLNENPIYNVTLHSDINQILIKIYSENHESAVQSDVLIKFYYFNPNQNTKYHVNYVAI